MLIKSDIRLVNGAEAVIKTLTSLGTDTIFGYPGGVVINLYDELYKQSVIKHVLVRHEQAAVHAAEGYARVTGKCGVVIVTSGPGATNTVSGIANAYLDGYPVVVLTGQVYNNLIGKDAFQEADICDITKSCTKGVFKITKAEEVQSVLSRAFGLATEGKKGPVVVDISRDIFQESVEYTEFSECTKCVDCVGDLDLSYYKQVFDVINSSNKPVIVAGGGVIHANAYDNLYKFAKKLSIPVVSTMMGLGSFPFEDENYFGMIGIFGDNSANEILRNSDLVLSLGARYNDRITCVIDENKLADKLIQVDINKKELGRVFTPKMSILSDISIFLDYMLQNTDFSNKFNGWLKSQQKLKNINVIPRKTTNMLHSFEVIQCIENFTKDKNVIFTSEVGQHQLWAVKNLKFNKNRKILVSGGSGTMGFGLPAAIGACIAKPEKTVICITGDGSFQMSIGELAECKDYNLNLKIMILNNGYLGMVRQLQQKNCDAHYSETKISNPDYCKLAESYGIGATRVYAVNEISQALEKAFSKKGTFIIDFMVEPMEIV